MRTSRPAANPRSARWLKAPENSRVSLPNLAMPAEKMALPSNRVVVAVKLVKTSSRAALIAKRANTPKRAMAIGRSLPNKVVGTERARSNGTIDRSNGITGPRGGR